jgi:hypothetical protein
MSEEEFELDMSFPLLSPAAFAEAPKTVLDSGQSFLETKNGFLYRIFPDGSKILIK